MADVITPNPAPTPVNGNGGLSAIDFISGLPSATIYGLLGVVGAGLAASVGFLPATIATISTSVVVGGSLFVVELVREALS